MKTDNMIVRTVYGNTQMIIESYRTAAEVVSMTESRPLAPCFGIGMCHRDDFFHDMEARDPHWSNFHTPDELKTRLTSGIDNAEALAEVKRYAANARVEEKEKLCRRVRRPTGCAVDVGRLLSGSPDCMWSLQHAKVKTKIIRIAVDTQIYSDVTVTRAKKAGLAVAKTIAKLERAGYRIQLNSFSSFCLSGSGTRRILTLNILHKEANCSMNYARMLYPVMDPSFFRGVCFGWVVCQPEMVADRSLGQGLNLWMRNDEEQIDDIIAQVNGPSVYLNLSEVISRLNSISMEQMEKELEAKFLGA